MAKVFNQHGRPFDSLDAEWARWGAEELLRRDGAEGHGYSVPSADGAPLTGKVPTEPRPKHVFVATQWSKSNANDSL